MPESDKSAITPAFTVSRYGGIYSMTKVPLPWWHWRALLSTLRHPRAAWRARREPRPDFVSYLGAELASRSVEEYERVARETRAIFRGQTALRMGTAEAEVARAAADASIFGAGYLGVHSDGRVERMGPKGFRQAGDVLSDWLDDLAKDPWPVDPTALTRDELLRRGHCLRPRTPRTTAFERYVGRLLDASEPPSGVPFFADARGVQDQAVPIMAVHPAARDEIAARLADQTVSCHACCGGPKKLGHEPGCEVGIRAMFASGRFDG